MGRIDRRLVLQAIMWTVGLSALTGAPAAAQRRERSWKAAARLQGEFQYDDNPYLLTSSQKLRLEQVSAADSQSGRFTDMESATDMIPAPSVVLGLEGPGLFGRALALQAEGTYEANLENARRRHAELGFSLQQALSRAGRFKVRADWRPAYFWKDYLADAVDANGDGNISPDERRYAPGTSHEIDLSLGYRHRLVHATKSRPVGLTGAIEVGYLDRRYDAPFSGRSRKGPGAGASLDLDLGRSWGIGLDYSYASLGGDPTREVLILNENDFGRDLNGNGNATDTEARAFELVDRSRREQNLGLSAHGDLSAALSAEFGYGRRFRHFTSTEPYDIVDRGRRDTRDEFAANLDFRLASGLHLTLGGQRAVQRTNRTGDPASTGEVADYTRHVGFAALRFKF